VINAARLVWIAWLGAAAIAVVGIVWHHMAIVGDGWWTIAAGRWLFQHRALPTVGDPFAFGSNGHWTIVSSGACVLFAAVANAGGPKAILMTATAVEAAAVFLLLHRSARLPLSRAVLLLPAIFFVHVDAMDLSARGQVFGDLGLVLELGMLRWVRDEKAPKPPALFYALVFVHSALWTNLHLSFIAATALPIVAAGCCYISERSVARLRPFLAMAGVAAIATFVNPYGPAYLKLALGTAFDPSTVSLDLFASPDFHEPMWLIAPVLGVALVFLRGVRGSERFRLGEQLFLLFFVLAACRSRRFATTLTAVEIAIAGPLLDDVLAKIKRKNVAPIALLGSGVLALGAGILWLGAFDPEPKDPFRDVPVKTTALAKQLHSERAQRREPMNRIVEPLHWGGYSAHEWMGTPKYFIDGRDHLVLFGNGAFEDHGALWSGATNALEVLDVYEAGVVLWETGRPLDLLLRQSPTWTLVAENGMAVLYVRTSRSRPESR